MEFNKKKYINMIKGVQGMHKDIEEHCNYQIIVREVFRRIEEKFDSEHFCDCPEWCTCWEDFKEKILKEK